MSDNEMSIDGCDYSESSEAEITHLQADVERLQQENVSLRSGIQGDLLRLFKNEQQRAEQLQRERDAKGFVLPMCDQSSPISEAMSVAEEQLRKGGE